MSSALHLNVYTLAIDCASDEPGVALAEDGRVLRALTWATERNHSVELLPNIERLLADCGRTKGDIGAVCVDIGPGGYAALRVGVSIAKALAHGLGVPLAGVGRLELDAHAALTSDEGPRNGRIVAVHRAGRGEYAAAAYRAAGGPLQETQAPALVRASALAALLEKGDAITGDIDDVLREAAAVAGARIVEAAEHRVLALAAVGHERIAAGRTDDPAALVPLYLRAPAIGPPR